MSLSPDDLDPLSKDVFSERRISSSIFCGGCGYNLRTLGYIGRCPECGNEYNARPTALTGIYLPTEVRFPLVELICAVFFLGAGALWVMGGTSPVVPAMLTLGAMSGVVSAISGYLFYRRLGRYLHFLWVSRHIDDD